MHTHTHTTTERDRERDRDRDNDRQKEKREREKERDRKKENKKEGGYKINVHNITNCNHTNQEMDQEIVLRHTLQRCAKTHANMQIYTHKHTPVPSWERSVF